MTIEQEQKILSAWGLMEDSWPIEKTGNVWMEYQVNFSVVIAMAMHVDPTEVQEVMNGSHA